jgi:hypothetical protein
VVALTAFDKEESHGSEIDSASRPAVSILPRGTTTVVREVVRESTILPVPYVAYSSLFPNTRARFHYSLYFAASSSNSEKIGANLVSSNL